MVERHKSATATSRSAEAQGHGNGERRYSAPRKGERGFRKGLPPHPSSSRLGRPNKLSREVKEMIDDGFERLGGLDGLVAWAQKSDEHLTAFYTRIWIKSLPITLNAKAHKDVTYRTVEEIKLAFMERGLTLEGVARLHQIESQLLEMSAADAGASEEA